MKIVNDLVMGSVPNLDGQQLLNSLDIAQMWFECIDIHGNTLSFNDFAEQASGFERDQFLLNQLRWSVLFFDQTTGKKFRELCIAAIKNNTGFGSEEVEIKTRSGQVKIFSWALTVIEDMNSIPCGALLAGIDITDRVTQCKLLKQNETKLQALFSALDEVVMMFNSNGDYLFISPASEDLLIAPKNNLQGNNICDFFDTEQTKSFLHQINKSLEQKQTIGFLYSININGKQVYFDAHITPVSENEVIWVARDVSQKIISEKVDNVMLNISRSVSVTNNLDEMFENIRQELSAIIDTRNFFIALFDIEKNTLSLPYFRDEKDKFDSFPAERTLSSVVLNQKQSLLLRKADLEGLIAKGKIDQVGTMAKVWIGIPLMVKGEVVGIMVVQNYEDENAFNEEHLELLETISPQISLSIQRKQSEQLLKESEMKLRESNLTKDRFFNIIAHDLKNPFNAIIGFSNLIIEEWNEFGDEEKIAMISSIKASSEGAYELLMNLLEWSRLHVGKITYNPEFIDISTLVRLNFSLLKAGADAKNIQLKTGETCDKMVWADPNMINTVIRNLLTNAVKFTRQNGNIRINCQKMPKHPGMVVISIEDSGVGIDDKKLSQIFEITSDSISTGTSGETGTGLGLVLCKEFIEINKGQIWVESQRNVGSTFFFSLPFKPF